MDIQIYFGKVVDVSDELKINRVKVTIPGHTEQIPVDQLPWYYPFFGIDYLPIKDDEVPVIIFNNDFTTGMYNNRLVANESIDYDGSEYENYLEIYKRNGVQLSFNEADGIRMINQKSLLQVEDGRVSMYVEDNQVTLNESRIDLGTDGEPAPLGDMTVESFVKAYNGMVTMYEHMIKMFESVKNGASSSPTRGIRIGLTATIPAAKSAIPNKLTDFNKYSKTIRSKKTFIE